MKINISLEAGDTDVLNTETQLQLVLISSV